jgi:hypothetical protein
MLVSSGVSSLNSGCWAFALKAKRLNAKITLKVFGLLIVKLKRGEEQHIINRFLLFRVAGDLKLMICIGNCYRIVNPFGCKIKKQGYEAIALFLRESIIGVLFIPPYA